MFRYCPACRTALEDRLVDGVDRRACPNCEFVEWGNPTPTAMTLVRCGDRLLFIRQPFFPPRHWGLINGFVERGENAEQAAVREVKEEVGLDVRLARVVGTFYYERRNLLLIGFLADADSTDVTPSDEISEWRWVAPADVRRLELGDAVKTIAAAADVELAKEVTPRRNEP